MRLNVLNVYAGFVGWLCPATLIFCFSRRQSWHFGLLAPWNTWCGNACFWAQVSSNTEFDMERVILQFMCVVSLAGVTYLRYTVLMSSNKSETAVHCCDPALSESIVFIRKATFQFKVFLSHGRSAEYSDLHLIDSNAKWFTVLLAYKACTYPSPASGLCKFIIRQTPVIQKGWITLSTGKIAIQRISVDKTNHAIHWIVIYPVDSVN